MEDTCKEDIVKRKKGEAKFFDESDKEFEKDPFRICIPKW